MDTYEIEKLAFLYLCNKEYESFILGKKEMTYEDFDSIIKAAQYLGLLGFAIDFQESNKHLFPDQFKDDSDNTDWKPDPVLDNLFSLMLDSENHINKLIKHTRNTYTRNLLKNFIEN